LTVEIKDEGGKLTGRIDTPQVRFNNSMLLCPLSTATRIL